MSALVRIETLVWLLLASATGLSWWLGADHGVPAQGKHVWITIAVMLIAFIKARLIIYHFMEVHAAPWPLKLICNAWVFVVGAAVIGLYWSGARG